MRTYQSKEKPGKKMSKKTLVTLLSSCAVIILALAITLPLVLSNSGNKKPSGGEPEPEPLPTVKPISFVMPMNTYTLGMEFNITELLYSSTLNQWRTHSGVDFLAASGAEVKAIADGTVKSVTSTTLEGYIVTITHQDGFESVYKSLGENPTAVVGAQVVAGEKIGIVDTTMITEQAEGAHLHLELYRNKKLVNPLDYVPYQGSK